MKYRICIAWLLGIWIGYPLMVCAQNNKPNILVIMTDQQSSQMLSITGNKWLDTPNLDRLARQGVRFEKAYATNPVCVPSRFSLQTGLYPSIIGVRHNESKVNSELNEKLIKHSLGQVFRNAGYETIYGGKVHLPGHFNNIKTFGYSLLTNDSRGPLARKSADYLLHKAGGNQPFFMFLSFINPHDICYNAIKTFEPNSSLAQHAPKPVLNALEKPEGISEKKFWKQFVPPLPSNFEPTVGEPQAIRNLIALRSFRKRARENWDIKGWRRHRWAYKQLTERADSLIGIVLDALEKSGLKDNTIVVFTSDHGDMDSSHRLEHKTVFYREAVRIPFIFAGKGIISGQADNHLVSNGLDLFPTLCDLAGIEPPDGLEGRSLKPLLTGKSSKNWREYLFAENQIGFMVTDGRYKYRWYDGTDEEMFTDLINDPGEMINIIPYLDEYKTDYKEKYKELKAVLFDHLESIGMR